MSLGRSVCFIYRKHALLLPSLALRTWLCLAAFCTSFTSQADEVSSAIQDSASVTIRFKVAKTAVDRAFSLNSQNLASADSLFAAIGRNEDLTLSHIYVSSAASPEGKLDFNIYLSRKRAESVIAFLKRIAPEIPDEKYVITSNGEDWSGAIEFVRKSDMKYKDEALSIMANASTDRKQKMKALDGGNVWSYMVREFFPSLRKTDVTIEFERKSRRPVGEQIAALDGLIAACTLPAPASGLQGSGSPTPEINLNDHYSIALKTNLLFDAATAVNASIEFPIGQQFSVLWMDIFPWWSSGPYHNKYALQCWTMGPEFRWWFARTDKRKYLTGHFAGVYAYSGKADFQRDVDLCYQSRYWSAGLSYGFAMPVCKWLNMEFSVSAGYLRANYQHYVPGDGYNDLYIDKYNAGHVSYFGPTNLQISLVVPLNFKYKVK